MNVYIVLYSRHHLPLPAGWVGITSGSSLVVGSEPTVVAPPDGGDGGGGAVESPAVQVRI